jgi:hypothetical protein
VIDHKTGAVTTWKIPGHTNVDALALDEARHRLFAASLQPGRLTVVDTPRAVQRLYGGIPAVGGPAGWIIVQRSEHASDRRALDWRGSHAQQERLNP